MPREAFITPEMSILLDAVRALAALLVLGGHIVQVGLYTGPYPFSQTMQHNAVIVFFVLSGIVIAHSVDRRHASFRDYAIARAARILPVSLFAIVFGTAAYLVAGELIAPSAGDCWYGELSPAAVILPAFFLSESWNGVGPVWNPPYWSLVYEVWFYAIFAAFVFAPRGWRWPLMGLLTAIAGWRIVLMLPIWAFGAWLSRHASRRVEAVRGVQLIAMGAILVALSNGWGASVSERTAEWHSAIGYDLKLSRYFLTDWLFGIGIALAFIGVRPLARRYRAGLDAIRRPIVALAGISFTLYLLHWPILLLLVAGGWQVGRSPAGFAALVVAIVLACTAIASVTEHRNRNIRAWLHRHLQRRSPALAAE
ncbi:acyltransferase family protein [Aurantiacibacter luteus]|uniref:Acyltransferase 3 domain-containing protein n=1 Tax=Aurantiacibacter luteus TaxID=1581420 RepID=A0A0G9N113_9SPHN|nr:acyltransferase [Aurantiacibacter luteus]KLE35223.1 hypothetical protein AAW00_01720 [Aurantiacibacter luteus]